MLVVSSLKKKMEFSTYGNPRLAEELTAISDAVIARVQTVSGLYRLLIEYDPARDKSVTFKDYLKKELRL